MGERAPHDNGEKTSDYASGSDPETAAAEEALDDDPVYSYKEQRKIIHRLDRRLITIAGIIYMNSLMDRSNLPNAAIAGMLVDLKMNQGFRYSTVALVFFITYTIFQPPATILTRYFGPRPFLSTISLLWGAVMIGFGFVQDWWVLIPLRLLLGLFEAGYFPGVVYLISTWYSRYDMQKRYAAFYSLGLVSSGLSGILAYGVQQMDGLGGLEGWRWIFVIFGLMTIVAAVLGAMFLVDFPDKALDKNHWRFLSRDEIQFILRQNMGFSIGESQMLTAPPYAGAAIIMFICAWIGDKHRIRGPLLVANAILGIIGLALLGYAGQAGVRYFGSFLVCAAANGGIPTVMAYQANNIRGQWTRAFASATLVGFGGIGGIAGSTVFRTQDAPRYLPGVWACMACWFMILILVAINTVMFKRLNKKADRGEIVLEGDAKFRYTI